MIALLPAIAGYSVIGLASYLVKYQQAYMASIVPPDGGVAVTRKEKNAPVEEAIDTSLITGPVQKKGQPVDRTEQVFATDRDTAPSKASVAEKIVSQGDKSLAPLPVLVPLNYVKAPRVAVHSRGGVGIMGRARHADQAGQGFTPAIVGGWLPIQREPVIVATETDSSGNVNQYRAQSSFWDLFRSRS